MRQNQSDHCPVDLLRSLLSLLYSVFPHNTCKYRKGCRRKKVYGTGECKHPPVPTCRQCELLCNRYCEQYEEEVCTHRFKPPYACNGCREVKKCTLTKTVYDALEAQRKATAKISESRSGILSTEGEIARLNEILVPLVKQGQSIHQLYLNNKDELMCSEKTLYNYVDGCLFDIRNIDLPRKVKYRPRYKEPELKIDRGCRVGRNYHDYEVYMEKHPDTAVVQMDSVIGSRGGKVLLTVYFVNVSLMPGFLREANTSKPAIDICDELYQRLGGQDFRRLFPVILTDNGSEFSNPKCSLQKVKLGYKTGTSVCNRPEHKNSGNKHPCRFLIIYRNRPDFIVKYRFKNTDQTF